MTEKRHQWASNLGFILAAAGSAVGLGNIWKFPGKVGAYGGGAFLLCYLLIVFLVGFPVMLAELSIGRATQKNVVGAFRTLNPRWRFAGYIGIVTLFVILSYYCVVGGWVLKYVQIYAAGAHFGAGPGAYADYFSAFSAKPVEPLLWGLGFLVLCIVVVVRGVSQGIEKVSKVLMPLLFLLLAGLVVYSVTRPGAGEGLRFLFGIDPARLSGDTLVGALGQAFFSLSITGSGMIIYGSYLSKSENIIHSSCMTAVLDTCAALLAGLAIIPAVFAFQMDPASGPPLMFITLPKVFSQIPFGNIIGGLFFLSVLFAGITSLMNMFEVCAEALQKTFRIRRKLSILITGTIIFIIGLFIENEKYLGSWMDVITIYVVPFGALLGAFMIYWILDKKKIHGELNTGAPKPVGKFFTITSKYIYVFLAVIVFILGIIYGGIG